LTYTGATLREVLANAHNVRPAQINGPAWIDEDRYEISAKIPSGVGPDQIPAMLQHMLAERFKIVTHRESKEQPVYALLVAKTGLKLKRSVEEIDTGSAKAGSKLKKSGEVIDVHSAASAENGSEGYSSGSVWLGPGAPPTPAPGRGVAAATGAIRVHHATVAFLAKELASNLDRPVVDMTGIPGEYDFDLNNRADIVSELRAYGLTLESRKAAVDVLVVDRGQRRPIEN
jgi:uncharacterized protein (TIGR03435 family)